MLLLQAITIDDRRYRQASKTVDFIQRYIFPGGCLPSISVMAEHLRESTDLCIYHLEDITQHYVTTLKRWREAFLANLDQVHAQGFSDEFVRMWEYYLCYCEGGFKERAIGTVHLMATNHSVNPGPNLSHLKSDPVIFPPKKNCSVFFLAKPKLWNTSSNSALCPSPNMPLLTY